MALVKRHCSVCKHETRQMVGCDRSGCASRDTGRAHDHCDQDQQEDHRLCSPFGCKGTTEPLALVNPDVVTGESGKSIGHHEPMPWPDAMEREIDRG